MKTLLLYSFLVWYALGVIFVICKEIQSYRWRKLHGLNIDSCSTEKYPFWFYPVFLILLVIWAVVVPAIWPLHWLATTAGDQDDYDRANPVCNECPFL